MSCTLPKMQGRFASISSTVLNGVFVTRQSAPHDVVAELYIDGGGKGKSFTTLFERAKQNPNCFRNWGFGI
jgi:hypothetical protein